LNGEPEAFFGEKWIIAFPKAPLIAETFESDHPPVMDRFTRRADPAMLATLAVLANQKAVELNNRPSSGGLMADALNQLFAEQALAESQQLIKIGKRRIIEGGGEKLVPVDDVEFSLVDTLQEPNMISVAAASSRLQLARGSGVLEQGIDAAV